MKVRFVVEADIVVEVEATEENEVIDEAIDGASNKLAELFNYPHTIISADIVE